LYVLIKSDCNRFCRGSAIESTTLPITLILEFCQLPITIGNVIVSIRFQSQMTKLPISAAAAGDRGTSSFAAACDFGCCG